jgi:hypothetical protein
MEIDKKGPDVQEVEITTSAEVKVSEVSGQGSNRFGFNEDVWMQPGGYRSSGVSGFSENDGDSSANCYSF